MRITTRTVRNSAVACGAAAAATALAVSTATSGSAVSTAIVIGGIGTPSLHDVVMSELLGGALRDYDRRVSVNWPAEARPYTGETDMTLGESIDIGTANLDAQIDDALAQLERDADGRLMEGEEVTVVGLSAGSLVVTETLREMTTDDEDDPEADALNVVVVADSSRQEIIDDTEEYNPEYDYTYRPPPQTVYDTVEVTGEYDGMADFPDRWWNLTAIQNAIAGSALVHVPTMFSDLSQVPKQNTTVTENALGGTTVRYLVPAETLPLVQVNPSLAPREAQLRAQVDSGYSRNDPANVAARLAGPDVPQKIRDIVTPDADSDPVGETAVGASDESALGLSTPARTAASDVPDGDTGTKPPQRDGAASASDSDTTTDSDSETDSAGKTRATDAAGSSASTKARDKARGSE